MMSTITQPKHAAQFLTVREGWYLGYPIIGEAPLQLVEATRHCSGAWQFHRTAELTEIEWDRLRNANYCHFYVLAGSAARIANVPTEWMLLVGKSTSHEYSTMRHFRPRYNVIGSGIGV